MFYLKTCCNVTFLSEVKCFSLTLLAAQLTVKPLLEANWQLASIFQLPAGEQQQQSQTVCCDLRQQPFSVCSCAEETWKVNHSGPDSTQFYTILTRFKILGFPALPDNQRRWLPPTIPDNTSWTNIENQFQSRGRNPVEWWWRWGSQNMPAVFFCCLNRGPSHSKNNIFETPLFWTMQMRIPAENWRKQLKTQLAKIEGLSLARIEGERFSRIKRVKAKEVEMLSKYVHLLVVRF